MRILLIMAAILSFEISIGNYVFRRVSDVKIETSWKTLGDTAEIILPNLKALLDEKSEGGGIKGGDQVTIKLGYNDQLNTEFEGFVRRVEPNVPLKILCEDYLYLLKRQNLSMSWPSVSLKEVLQFIIKDTPITLSGRVPDVKLTKFRLNQVNGATALDKIKKELGLFAFLRGKVLYVGFGYLEPESLNGNSVLFEYGKNLVETDLTYREAKDTLLRVKAVSILKDNKKLTVEFGDTGGEQRTLYFYNISDKATLEKRAREELNRIKRDGYEGKITAFGLPYVTHGDVVSYADPTYPERAGRYVVDEVAIASGQNGYRREIALGLKLND